MTEVLIVGAGPVGLTLAVELARRGRACRIVDRLAAPLPFCRAIGVTPRTLELWDALGIAREALDAGIGLTGLRLVLPGQAPRDIHHDPAPLIAAAGPTFFPLGLPQDETERILAARLAGLGVAVERGVALTEASQDAGGVDAVLEGPAGRERLRLRYLVGCDGAHSLVRRLAGIAFEGDAYDDGFMLGDVAVDWDLPRGLSFRALRPVPDAPPEMFIAVPLPDPNRYRVSALAPPGAGQGDSEHGLQVERPGPTLDQLQAAADALVPGRPRLSDLRWSSFFRISMRLAAAYRSGNFFLAGDAAHIHPPTGGQGMNTGIQDACNLAWKLALVLEGAAPADLLDSYEAERRPVGAAVIARTRAASESLGREPPKAARPDQARSNPGRPDPGDDSQLFLSYADAGWSRDDADGTLPALAPAAGARAPNCEGLRRDGAGFALRLFEILAGTDFVLLAPAAAGRQVERWRHDLGPRADRHLRCVLVASADEAGAEEAGAEEAAAAAPPRMTLLRDVTGDYARRYGAGCYLVRPDGHVAWRGSSCEDSGLMSSWLRFVGGLN